MRKEVALIIKEIRLKKPAVAFAVVSLMALGFSFPAHLAPLIVFDPSFPAQSTGPKFNFIVLRKILPLALCNRWSST